MNPLPLDVFKYKVLRDFLAPAVRAGVARVNRKWHAAFNQTLGPEGVRELHVAKIGVMLNDLRWCDPLWWLLDCGDWPELKEVKKLRADLTKLCNDYILQYALPLPPGATGCLLVACALQNAMEHKFDVFDFAAMRNLYISWFSYGMEMKELLDCGVEETMLLHRSFEALEHDWKGFDPDTFLSHSRGVHPL